MKLSSIFSFVAVLGLTIAAAPQKHIKAVTITKTKGFHTVSKTRGVHTVTRTRSHTPHTPTPTSGVIQGFDVSHFQKTVDFAAAYKSGARFVYSKATDGTTLIDKTFAGKSTAAAAAGLLHGAYHFARPSTGTGATQANFFLAHGGNPASDGKTLISFVDLEANPKDPQGAGVCYNLSPKEMVTFIADFVNTYKAATGKAPMIYTTNSWWKQCTGNSKAFSSSPLMLARYAKTPGAIPGGWAKYTIWQNSDKYTYGGDSDKLSGGTAALNALLQ
ncbi:MAG: hypothetical protein MMC33_007263 [Icmadophila ericetorum]|nr:hypothetical protein [Icmadophila ericetorum]